MPGPFARTTGPGLCLTHAYRHRRRLGVPGQRHSPARSPPRDIEVRSSRAAPRPARPHSHGSLFVNWTPDGTHRTLGQLPSTAPLPSSTLPASRLPPSAGRLRKSRSFATAGSCATRSLTTAIRQAARRLRCFISGSAVGYYGDRGDETLTEVSPPGTDFLAGVAKEWEAAANEVANVTRVALVRTGIVLDRRGGALPKMLPPFQMFAGGPLGSGTQYMPWIHKDDWVRMVSWMITAEGARGPLNATSPAPVTNAEFSRALGHALKRPSALRAPAFALRLALGRDGRCAAPQRPARPARCAQQISAFRSDTPISTRRSPASWPKISPLDISEGAEVCNDHEQRSAEDYEQRHGRRTGDAGWVQRTELTLSKYKQIRSLGEFLSKSTS